MTQIGITMGTPLYMSPEQVEGGSLDSRSDIYSLGVTAYHMLAGQPPFEGENALAIAVQQVKEAATPLASVRPDLPSELCDLIHRMIAKDPADRPQNPGQLIKELRKIKINVDEDWDELIEKLAAVETGDAPNATSYSQARLAATQQLQAVMKGNIRSWWKHPATLVSLLLLSFCGLISGSLIATNDPPKFPLDVGAIELNEIPRKSNVKEQYESAYWGTYALGPEGDQKKIEYWKAVSRYFPLDDSSESLNTTRLYHRLAKARLGEVYLSQRKLPEALEIYEDLESQQDVSDHFRMMGSAGKAIVFDLMPAEDFPGGKPEQEQIIRECLSNIGSNIGLLNDFMRSNIEEIQNRLNRRLLSDVDLS